MPRAETYIETVVADRVPVTTEVIELVLRPAAGASLPYWSPGAHIDVQAGDLARQYSLIGSTADGAMRIAVLREPDGRGGSEWLHRNAVIGARIEVNGPRNHFGLDRSPRFLFIAGGIGITPFLPMITEVSSTGSAWELHYAGRSRATMAFADRLLTDHGDAVHLYPADEGRRLDLPDLLAGRDPGRPGDGLLLYTCGPRRLLAEVEELTADWPPGTARGEHFVPREVGPPVWDGDFEVDLLLSGMTLTVPPDRSILSVVEERGVPVLSSCAEGTCGTCETPVIEGEIDHRDSILTPAERADGDVMMICVSRAACPRLMLEL